MTMKIGRREFMVQTAAATAMAGLAVSGVAGAQDKPKPKKAGC